MNKKIIWLAFLIIILAVVGFWVLFDRTDFDTTTGIPSPTLMTPDGTTGTPTPVVAPKGQVLMDVAFTAQAPLGEWSDPRQQDGCEEASSLMAIRWALGLGVLTPEQYKQEIIAISDYQLANYGSFYDTSAQDTLERIIRGYFDFDNAEVVRNITAQDIVDELYEGNVIIVPADGRLLGNPNFTPPGPERHMLVVIGYDPARREFITNDPGTRQGRHFRYDQDVFINAVGDYTTGFHEPIRARAKVMIVVSG